MWARCQKASFPRQRITMRLEQKGWRHNLEGGRGWGGDGAKEWSLTPDLADIILKMQINPYFQKWSRTTRGQTCLTLKPDETTRNHLQHASYRKHSKRTFKLFYTNNSFTQGHKQLGPNPTEKVRKPHTSINIDALTTTLSLLNSLSTLKRTSIWLCVYTSLEVRRCHKS